jgi:hypothetical protein
LHASEGGDGAPALWLWRMIRTGAGKARTMLVTRTGQRACDGRGGVREQDRGGALKRSVLYMQLKLHAYRKTR